MAIAVTNIYNVAWRDERNRGKRRAVLEITGLALGNNTVPHGLPVNVDQFFRLNLEPTSSAQVREYQPSDNTNLYINASAADATCNAILDY